MKVIIAGSRECEDFVQVMEAVKASGWAPHIKEVVSGGARGVDTIGVKIAARADWDIKLFPYLKQYGKVGGPIRNKQMAIYADALIAVWDGASPGTANMVHEMKKLSKPVHVHYLKKELYE